MKLNINPFDRANPMSLAHAAALATIVAFVTWILSFFANAQYIDIAQNCGAWAFVAVKTYLVSWAGTFMTLAGLEQLMQAAKQPEQPAAPSPTPSAPGGQPSGQPTT
jgi:hypothetical protein